MTPDLTGNALVFSAVIAYMGSSAIEWLKQQKWFPWMTADSTVLNRWVGRLVAAVSVVGIHMTFDPNAGTLLVSGLSLAGIGGALVEFVKQYLLQQIAYRSVVKPVASPPVPV